MTFHSNFMAGKPVQCAGMIEIEHGIVTKISNDSGHYKPVDPTLTMAISHLQLAGMNLKKMTATTVVPGEEMGISVRADKFLAANGNWAASRSSEVKPAIPSRGGRRLRPRR